MRYKAQVCLTNVTQERDGSYCIHSSDRVRNQTAKVKHDVGWFYPWLGLRCISRCLPDDTLDRIHSFQSSSGSITWAQLSVLILSGTTRGTACFTSRRSRTSSSASSVASATSEASEAHSSAEEAHDLREESAAASTSPVGSSSAHTSNVLSLWLDGQLTTFKQWFVQVLCLHGALFRSKLDICLPIDWKVEVKLGCN